MSASVADVSDEELADAVDDSDAPGDRRHGLPMSGASCSGFARPTPSPCPPPGSGPGPADKVLRDINPIGGLG